MLFLVQLGIAFAGVKLSEHHVYVGEHNGLHGIAFAHNSIEVGVPRKRSAGLCSGAISEGARWKSPAGYYLNTDNRFGLSDAFVTESIASAFDSWRCAIGGGYIGPMLGTFEGDIVMDRPTGRNEVSFGSISGKPGTIALTVIWGVFSGPIERREIREFKMLFDQEHFEFGEGLGVMDLQAIATHEAGHAFGLADITNPICRDVTMFASSNRGESGKRSLEEDDLEGIQRLYPL